MGVKNIFACAAISSEEDNYITKSKLEQMASAKRPEEAVKFLTDAHYAREGETITSEKIDAVLEIETEYLENLVKSIIPNEDIFKIFYLPVDYHNIKAILKSEVLGTDPKNILMDGGTISAIQMAYIIKERDYPLLTSNMKHAIEDSIEKHARTNDPQAIDLICDKACFQDIIEVTEAYGNDFATGYVKLWIDTINLKTFVRTKQIKESVDYFKEVYIKGGNINIEIFTKKFDEPFHQFYENLVAFEIYEAAKDGGAALRENGSFTVLEKLCDNILIAYAQKAKALTFGVEPVMAYYIAKQMEIKSVRIIIAGRKAKLDDNLIKERIRDTYE